MGAVRQAYSLSARAMRVGALSALLMLLTLTACAPAPSTSQAGGPVILTNDRGRYPLGLYLEALPDPSGRLTLADVMGAYAGQFEPSERVIPGYGLSEPVMWVRFGVRNESQFLRWLIELADPLMQAVELYLPEGGAYSVKQAGLLRPEFPRDIQHHHYVFELLVPPGEEQVIYMRVQTELTMRLPLTLWSTPAFARATYIQQFAWGGVYTGLLLLAIYNLFLYAGLLDRNFLLLGLFIVVFLIQTMINDGRALVYIGPGLGPFYPVILPVMIAAAQMAFLVFTASFLDTQRRRPALHRLIQGALLVLAISMAATFAFSFRVNTLIQLTLGPALILLAVWIGLQTWRDGFRPARYYVTAGFAPLALGILVIPQTLGVLPPSEVFDNTLLVGVVLLPLFLSFALVDRYNMLEEETETANAKLTAITARYQSVLNDQLDFVCRFLPDGALTFVNQAYAHYFGRTVEELSYFNLYQLIPPEDREATRAAVASITPDHPINVHENRVYDAQGKVRWQRWTNRGFFNAQGEAVEYQATGQDITEQRMAEEEVRRYRDHLQELVTERTQDLERVNAVLSRRVEELTTLNTVSQTVASASDLATILERIAATLTNLFHAFSTGISVFNEDRTERILMAWYTSDRDYDGPNYVGHTFSLADDRAHAQLQQTKRAFAIEGPGNHPLVSPRVQALMTLRGVHSVLYAPLLARAEVIGSITISTTEPDRRFTESELRLVETIAVQLAGHIETAKLLELEHHQRERAESLQAVATILNSSLDQKIVLGKILEQLHRVTHYDGAAVCLLEGDALVISDATGIARQWLGRRIELDEKYSAVHVLIHHTPLIISDTHLDPRWTSWDDQPAIRSWLGAPLMAQGQPIGVLTIDSEHVGAYSAADARVLQAFADQAAVAVSNARLYQQAQSAAAAGERERLARDLHDAVTQTIFSASIIAEALPLQMKHDPDGALNNLGKLSHLTRGALAEMRGLLMELRPATLTEVTLAQLLQLLHEAFTGRHPIPVELTLSGDSSRRLPPEVQIVFYRIAQEAFSNISKHAHASQVAVQLHQDPYTVLLTIADNGCGFDPAVPKPGHMGLSIMQERAEHVGAALCIDSAPGAGARITLRWQSPEEAMEHA